MRIIGVSIISITLGLLTFLVVALPAHSSAQGKKVAIEEPIAKQGLLDALHIRGFTAKALVQEIKKRGVAFEVTPPVEAELRSAGAKPVVIDAARANYRPLVGTLNVTTTVLGATISIAGLGRYTDRITALKLPPGNYEITAGKLGYKPDTRRIAIKFGETASVELRLAPLTASELLKLAEDTYALSNFPIAILLARELLRKEPDQPKATSLLASSLYMQGEYDEAITHFTKAISLGESATIPVLHKHGGSWNGKTLCSGRITLTRDSLEFYSSDFPDEGFRIPYSKIIEMSIKDQMRLSLTVRAKFPKKQKESDKEYSLYSTDAVAGGTLVVCPQCLSRMRVILQLIRPFRTAS